MEGIIIISEGGNIYTAYSKDDEINYFISNDKCLTSSPWDKINWGDDFEEAYYRWNQ
jgi:hypothetical protein